MKHVKIQSDVTIQVTSGLQHIDLTDKKSDIKDRVKVKADWKRCLIKQGKGIYPAEIAEWPTVKALEKDGIITIGAESEEPTTAEIKNVKDMDGKAKAIKDVSLEAVAKE